MNCWPRGRRSSVQVATDSWTLVCRWRECGETFMVPVHRGRPPAYCSDDHRRKAAGRAPLLRLVRGHLPTGDKPVLHAVELAEVLPLARRIDRHVPRGERTRAFDDLGERFGVTGRSIYRYLQYGDPVLIRVGPWSAYFATRRQGKRRDPAAPVQLTAWEKETHR
jgi:hypothetical protein